MTGWNPSRVTIFLERGVKALEDIARELKKSRDIKFQQNIANPPSSTEIYQQSRDLVEKARNLEAEERTLILPAYMMQPGQTERNLDAAPPEGETRISSDEISINIPRRHLSDALKQIIAEGDPIAFVVGITYQKSVE